MTLSSALARQFIGSIKITPVHLRAQFRWPLLHRFNLVTAFRTISTGVTKKTTTTKAAAKPKTATKPTTKAKKPVTAAKSTTTKKKTPAIKKPTATTKKRVVTKKAAPKRKVPKKAPRVELTDKQKLTKLIKQLKAQALQPPPRGHSSGYLLFFLDRKKDEPRASVVGAEWKALPQEKKDAYTRRAREDSSHHKQNYEAWIQSQSVDAIRKANNARRRLKSLSVKKGTTLFNDGRQPKKSRNALTFYVREQYQSGREFPKNEEGRQSATENLQILKGEYDRLPEPDKKRYKDMAAQDKQRYEAEKAAIEQE